MRCVPDAVSRLFPEIDLSMFPARASGYGLGDIQRMLPKNFSVWPLYVNHIEKAKNHDILRVLPKTENKIPLFLFDPKHCVFGIWSRSEILIYDGEKADTFDAELFFMTHKINQIAGVVDYNNYNLLTLKP